jgi:hypothetical protein
MEERSPARRVRFPALGPADSFNVHSKRIRCLASVEHGGTHPGSTVRSKRAYPCTQRTKPRRGKLFIVPAPSFEAARRMARFSSLQRRSEKLTFFVRNPEAAANSWKPLENTNEKISMKNRLYSLSAFLRLDCCPRACPLLPAKPAPLTLDFRTVPERIFAGHGERDHLLVSDNEHPGQHFSDLPLADW